MPSIRKTSEQTKTFDVKEVHYFKDLEETRGSLTKLEMEIFSFLLKNKSPFSTRSLRNTIIHKWITIRLSLYQALPKLPEHETKKAIKFNEALGKFHKLSVTGYFREMEKAIKEIYETVFPSWKRIEHTLEALESMDLVMRRMDEHLGKKKEKYLWMVAPKYRKQFNDGRKELQEELVELKKKMSEEQFTLVRNEREEEIHFYGLDGFCDNLLGNVAFEGYYFPDFFGAGTISEENMSVSFPPFL